MFAWIKMTAYENRSSVLTSFSLEGLIYYDMLMRPNVKPQIGSDKLEI